MLTCRVIISRILNRSTSYPHRFPAASHRNPASLLESTLVKILIFAISKLVRMNTFHFHLTRIHTAPWLFVKYIIALYLSLESTTYENSGVGVGVLWLTKNSRRTTLPLTSATNFSELCGRRISLRCVEELPDTTGAYFLAVSR